MKIGQYNKLEIIRKTNSEYYLDAGAFGEVLLSNNNVQNLETGDFLTVFIYTIADGELRATLDEPKACVGEFAYLKILDINKNGAFLDWGLEKDLFLPFRNQKENIEIGSYCLVYLYLDEISQRIVATTKIEKNFKDLKSFEVNQKVEILIYGKTDLGFKAIIDNDTTGLLYHKNIFKNIDIGDTCIAYIDKIREDGKIDLTVQKRGFHTDDQLIINIMEKLSINNGVLDISDKSKPDLIYKSFGVSKAQYKKAIGKLYKEKKIIIEKDCIKKV